MHFVFCTCILKSRPQGGAISTFTFESISQQLFELDSLNSFQSLNVTKLYFKIY